MPQFLEEGFLTKDWELYYIFQIMVLSNLLTSYVDLQLELVAHLLKRYLSSIVTKTYSMRIL